MGVVARQPAQDERERLVATMENRLRGARTKLLGHKNWAFFGNLAMHLKMQDVPGLGTCATDGDHFLYDPEVLSQEPADWQVFNWAHEIMHLIGLDLSKKPKDDVMVVGTDRHGNPTSQPFSLWNIACDHWNNLKLQAEGLTIPSVVPCDKRFSGMSKLEIFEALKKEVRQNPQKPLHGSTCGGFHGTPKDKSGKPGEPGAGAGGNAEPWRPTKADEERWKARAKQALEACVAQGKPPGFAKSMVRNLLKPRVPWRDILWPFCVRAGREWRYTPPSRTGAARGMVLPRLSPDLEIDHGVFVFDTSGSIEDVNLTEFCTEVQSILSTVRMKATVLICDAVVHAAYHFEPGEFDWKSIRFLGRGGTDFRPAFKWVEKHLGGEPPTFLVFFTDGYGTFPDTPPEYPVLWALTCPAEVPWGESLSIKEDPA